MTDSINHPAHYRAGGIEAIDVIEAYGLGYHLANAVKYILRAGRKTADPREDLRKALWYVERAATINVLSLLGTVREQGRPAPVEISAAFGLGVHLSLALGIILQPWPTKWDMPDAAAQLRFALELEDERRAAPPQPAPATGNVLPFFRDEPVGGAA